LISERERFNAVVLTAPLARADAIVALLGEDGLERGKVAQQLMLQGAAPKIVLSGGLESDSKQGARSVSDKMIGNGVDPQRIIEDTESTNTKEQSTWVAELATENDWTRLLLIASAYHLPRAFLTMIHAVRGSNIQIIPVTANHVPWFGSPEGVKRTRLELFEGELAKTVAHQELGHVASYADGLKHLRRGEGK
jgi:uncharacterized SAM-binding protein YcdF (DUF218 family)